MYDCIHIIIQSIYLAKSMLQSMLSCLLNKCNVNVKLRKRNNIFYENYTKRLSEHF